MGGFPENGLGDQEADDAAGPVQVNTCVFRQVFQQDVAVRGNDAEEVKVESHLYGCELIALAAKCAEVTFGALDKILEVFQGALQITMKLSVLNRFWTVDAV